MKCLNIVSVCELQEELKPLNVSKYSQNCHNFPLGQHLHQHVTKCFSSTLQEVLSRVMKHFCSCTSVRSFISLLFRSIPDVTDASVGLTDVRTTFLSLEHFSSLAVFRGSESSEKYLHLCSEGLMGLERHEGE